MWALRTTGSEQGQNSSGHDEARTRRHGLVQALTGRLGVRHIDGARLGHQRAQASQTRGLVGRQRRSTRGDRVPLPQQPCPEELDYRQRDPEKGGGVAFIGPPPA